MKSAAIITIKAPGRMSAAGRKRIAAWMRVQAGHLLKHGSRYTDGRFTARYIYK